MAFVEDNRLLFDRKVNILSRKQKKIKKSELISVRQFLQLGIQRTLQDYGYGPVHHAICLFTPPAFAGYSFAEN